MSNKSLYVGNLSFEVTADDLKASFGEVGEVASARVVTDRDTNRSRGFGFVEMATDELAEQAIKKFDNYELKGRPIRVRIAEGERHAGGGGGGHRGGGQFRGGGGGRQGGGGFQRDRRGGGGNRGSMRGGDSGGRNRY